MSKAPAAVAAKYKEGQGPAKSMLRIAMEQLVEHRLAMVSIVVIEIGRAHV